MLFLVCLLSLIALSGAMESSIVGGREAKPHSRPYLVSLQGQKAHFCGGMLVRNDFVLTAAHCWGSVPLEVVVGAHDITKAEKTQQRLKVDKYYPHPESNPTTPQNDIMLLKLKTKAKLSRFVRVLDLPKKKREIPALVNCSIAGWGRMTPNGAAANVLQNVALKLQFTFECKNKWQNYFNSSQNLCTVSDGRHAFCQGDSGSPLMWKGKPLGIATFTSPKRCDDRQLPQLYTKISSFMPWIRKIMGKNV